MFQREIALSYSNLPPNHLRENHFCESNRDLNDWSMWLLLADAIFTGNIRTLRPNWTHDSMLFYKDVIKSRRPDIRSEGIFTAPTHLVRHQAPSNSLVAQKNCKITRVVAPSLLEFYAFQAIYWSISCHFLRKVCDRKAFIKETHETPCSTLLLLSAFFQWERMGTSFPHLFSQLLSQNDMRHCMRALLTIGSVIGCTRWAIKTIHTFLHLMSTRAQEPSSSSPLKA